LEEADLRYFPEHDTVVAGHGSVFYKTLVVPANFICGFNCHFWKGLVVEGELLLGPHCTVKEDVRAASGIIGYRSVIQGNVSLEGDVRLMDGVEINGELTTEGRVLMRPDVMLRGIRNSIAVETLGD